MHKFWSYGISSSAIAPVFIFMYEQNRITASEIYVVHRKNGSSSTFNRNIYKICILLTEFSFVSITLTFSSSFGIVPIGQWMRIEKPKQMIVIQSTMPPEMS